jgi:hypothetical protein
VFCFLGLISVVQKNKTFLLVFIENHSNKILSVT